MKINWKKYVFGFLIALVVLFVVSYIVFTFKAAGGQA